jgi:hypothetical protein
MAERVPQIKTEAAKVRIAILTMVISDADVLFVKRCMTRHT